MNLPVIYSDDRKSLEGTSPIVILGPNGSGKTRYGLKIAVWNNSENIAALRNIALGKNVPMQALDQASSQLEQQKNQHKSQPWNIASEINNLFSKLMAEDSDSATRFRDSYLTVGGTPETTKLMVLRECWHDLFPGRTLHFGGYTPKVLSEYSHENGPSEYFAQTMSDGERVALYLAGRVLDAKAGIILIDEPEVHFHSRLAIQFWDKLESIRSDCRFVYITHDLTFAMSRDTQDYFIVRAGSIPELVNVGEGIPHDVTQEILSAASLSLFADRLVFCEGTESSYDQKLFRAFFNRRKDSVIPVGSCKEVVKCTTVFRNQAILSGVSAIGIVDRDYWPDEYLNSMPDGIEVLQVHEIESLYCKEGIFKEIAMHLGNSETRAAELYSNFLTVARLKFKDGLLYKQISERFRLRCRAQIDRTLSSLNVEGNESEVKTNHCSATSQENWNISPDKIFDEEKDTVIRALSGSSDEFIRVLPGKTYISDLANQLGFTKVAYADLIEKSLKSLKGDSLFNLGEKIRAILNEQFTANNGLHEDTSPGSSAAD